VTIPTIRLARGSERSEIVELQRRASLTWDEDGLRDYFLAHPEIIDLPGEMIDRQQVFVAEIGGRIVGFATIIPHEKGAELEGIFVEPDEWRKGIGRLLLDRIDLEAQARGVNELHVIANPKAQSFYARAGFRVTGQMKTQLGPTALLMMKLLA
jgi:GNAT superfamily N-acetyltransferase